MKCDNCNGNNATMIVEHSNEQKTGFLTIICTWVICLPWGVYNLVKSNKQTITNIKYCPDCGSKTKV